MRPLRGNLADGRVKGEWRGGETKREWGRGETKGEWGAVNPWAERTQKGNSGVISSRQRLKAASAP